MVWNGVVTGVERM